ncbi:unnamed protein product [Ectocarpus sp. CCAP 1310/34]|nr:unnamed protein product [Ectocarpus sp. CCAP 1310/34]
MLLRELTFAPGMYSLWRVQRCRCADLQASV